MFVNILMHFKTHNNHFCSNRNNTVSCGGGIGATDGTSGAAKFNSIKGSVERAGNIYVTDSNNGKVRKISNRVVTTMSMRSFRAQLLRLCLKFLFWKLYQVQTLELSSPRAG